MSCKRFFKLRAALHVTDSNAPRDPIPDKFWKVKPIIDAVRSRYLQLEPLADSCIDEQILSFTGMVAAKQFIHSKPNTEDVKVFVRCSADGMAHDFELYQGKGAGVSLDRTYLGLRGSVVRRLMEHLPHGKNVRCYMAPTFHRILFPVN